jgi:FSR family fosmidomycin resistance protein-like MFS transporter
MCRVDDNNLSTAEEAGFVTAGKIQSLKHETPSLASWAFDHRFKKPVSPVRQRGSPAKQEPSAGPFTMHNHNSSFILLIYGTAHFIIDACCAAAVFVAISQHELSADRLVAFFLLYHALAFGLQASFGLAIDAFGKPRLAAVIGCLLCATAFLLTSSPTGTVIIVGIGNALFHVGGGSVCLRTMPHKATGGGLFVAPGSLGLLLGSILGKQGLWACFPLIPVALILCFIIACTAIPPEMQLARTPKVSGNRELIIALILLPIFVRSMLGFIVHFPWTTQPGLLLGLTAATVLGKALGGILADRWGWIRVGIGSLLVSLPLLACVSTNPLAAIPGIFFLNFSMPITLAAIAEALPGRSAFAFGLTCLAILLGMFPTVLKQSPDNPLLVLLVVVLSAAALYRGLRLLPLKHAPSETYRCENEMA